MAATGELDRARLGHVAGSRVAPAVARGIDMTGRAETILGDEYMNGKRVITSAGVVVVGVMMTVGLAPAQVVMAAPILIVPCQVTALAAAIVSANSGSGAVPTVLRLAPRVSTT
jgi:hypothetical protein